MIICLHQVIYFFQCKLFLEHDGYIGEDFFWCLLGRRSDFTTGVYFSFKLHLLALTDSPPAAVNTGTSAQSSCSVFENIPNSVSNLDPLVVKGH